MSTPEEPSFDDVLARAREAAPELNAVLDKPVLWEPIWKRPRTPKSKAEKKQELRKQRRRLQDAGRRRFITGQSRRPRPRQNRIGNAAARRDARALSRVRHSNAWLW
ncbi:MULTISPECIES: hypothetical protein [unclassified Streptomyces]|uniref:hypothetical protein n=1 Tax=unclassified Streptomyces TaxID=2593676 RepID=UPI002E0D91F9|nr:hypothetical protein OG466_40590 [Streptomyces sp. NBC_01240]